MSFESIKHRLFAGRPLVLDADTGASFRARRVELDAPGALGMMLRKSPDDVMRHYRAEVRSRVDVLSALTIDTTPRALAEVGMQHRAALLTGLAVEFAIEAASESPKPVAVAGVLGGERVAPLAADRLHSEYTEHAERLAAAGCELLIARGQGSRLGLMAATVAAAGTELPTWAVIECLPNGEFITGGAVGPLVEALQDAGASVVLFEVPSIDAGVQLLERARGIVSSEGMLPGVLLAASSLSVRGFPDSSSAPEPWAQRSLELDAHGARVIGGGAGTVEAHTAALATALKELHPSLPNLRSDTELDRSPPGI
ncbi:MAG TPA: homocysteine S-methyltransferase family protein [Polyangiaceae bacterium]